MRNLQAAFNIFTAKRQKEITMNFMNIVAAVNEYFERQARLADDPYLETREKEDLFLKRITETIENSLRFVQPAVPTKAVNTDSEELSAALDFADSF